MTKEECLELGKQYILKYNCYPAAKRWTIASAGCSRDRIYKHWTGWPAFIADLKNIIEVPEPVQAPTYKWNEELCILSIQKSAKYNNGWPLYKDFINSNEYPSLYTIRKYLGSWEEALRSAGFIKNSFNDYAKPLGSLTSYLYEAIDQDKNINKKGKSTQEIVNLFMNGAKKAGWNYNTAITFTNQFSYKIPNTKYYLWYLYNINAAYCIKCKLVFDINNFNKCNKAKIGISQYCKTCISELMKQYGSRGKLRASIIKRRTPAWADLEAIKKFYKNRPVGYHVDHIIPLQGAYICGLHVENNLQYLPASTNLIKNNKFDGG
jgi:hypothetical protein